MRIGTRESLAAALLLVLGSACHTQKWQVVSSGHDEETYVQRIRMVTSTHGWAISSQGGLLETADGGRSWSERNPGDATWYGGIDFVGDVGLVAGGKLHGSTREDWTSVLLSTSDGGTHWASMKLPELGSVALVSMCNADVAWLSADRGGARTQDGGRTWVAASLPTRGKPTGLRCASADIAFVVETDGWVARTRDGGSTWSETQVAPGRILSGVAVAGRRVWVVGQQGTLFTSTDEGSGFQVVDLGRPEFLADIALQNQRGYIVGARGLILESLDAGASWRPVTSPTKSDLYCISAPAAGDAWAGGSKWTIVRARS